MNKLFDALDVCLQEIENGADLESVLARYPDLAGELRPILKTAMKAKAASVLEPSVEVVRRGRARVLQQASVMREVKAAPRRRVIPAFQRLAISFSLAALLLMSSTGLLNASASALPGENLYPVKRGWENIRLFLIFDQQARNLLKFEFENERLYEVSKLLAEGRGETIQFAGIFMQLSGKTYVSGVPVLLPAGMDVPTEGASVIVSGRTNSQGIVEIISLELMPDGALVPEGKPVEVELESDFGPGGEALYEIEGILDAVSVNSLVIEDITVYLDNPSSDWQLCIGMLIEVKGYYAADGRFMAVEVEGKGSCSHDQASPSAGGDSGASSNTNQDVNVNTNEIINDNDTNSNESNSNESNNNDDLNENSDGNENSNDDGSNDDNASNDDDSSNDDNSGGGSNGNDDSGGGDLNDNDDSGGDTNNNDDSGSDDNSNDDDSGSGGDDSSGGDDNVDDSNDND